jgi:translation initiation factor 1 (eIF-1/SUI1)
VVKNPSLVDEIDIQGDVKEDIVDFLLEKWPQVPSPIFAHPNNYLPF